MKKINLSPQMWQPFWFVAMFFMLFPPPWILSGARIFSGSNAASYIVLTLLYLTTAVLTSIAPFIVRRNTFLAIGFGASTFIPLNLTAFGGINFSLAGFFSLILVMFVSIRHQFQHAVLVACLAAIMPISYGVSPQTKLWTYGSTGMVSGAGETASARYGTAGMYLLGIVLMFALAMVMSRGARQKQERQEIENQAAEVDARAELARDLHDVVAHRISMVAVRAETAPYAHPSMDDESKAAFTEIAHDARGALDEMREVLGVLRRGDDMQRRPQPQTSDISTLFADARSVGTSLVIHGEIPHMNAVNGHVAYRVIQEALTNARRHGSGQPVTIDLHEDDGIVIRVSNPTRHESFVMGRGLSGMRERVIQRGGRFHADIVDGLFVIDVKLPKGEHE